MEWCTSIQIKIRCSDHHIKGIKEREVWRLTAVYIDQVLEAL